MAIVQTSVVIKCKDRREFKLVGAHVKSCQDHFDGCDHGQSFHYIANPLLLTYSGTFHDQIFEEWEKNSPVLKV
ncbi:MAG: hypothetical protein ACSHWQ_00060 [Spongiibacteraceae bacterium]